MPLTISITPLQIFFAVVAMVAINVATVALVMVHMRAPAIPAPPPPPPPSVAPARELDFRPRGMTTSTPAPEPKSDPFASAPTEARPFYLVASPESNGNRYLVKLLLAAGCRGRADHAQPLDPSQSRGGWQHHIRPAAQWPRDMRSPGARCIAMHRSMPHGGAWVDLPGLVAEIRAAGWEPRLLISLRPEDAVRVSQVKQGHVRTQAEAEANIARAQRTLIDAVAAMPDVWFRLVLYEQLGHDHYRRWLFDEQLGMPLPPTAPAFEDRDSKHFHGASPPRRT